MNSSNEKTGTWWYSLGCGRWGNDLADQLADLGLQANFSALPVDKWPVLLKFVEFAAPRLAVGDGLAP